MIVLIENVIMIESDSEHEQSILSDENFFTLANQNLIIEKVLISKKSFKRNLKFKSDLLSWKSIRNDDLNNQNFSDWLLIELSSINKILNKNSCQLKSMMFKALELNDDYLQKSQWSFHEKIEKCNESWNLSKKTDLLSFIFLYLKFWISVFISSELNIIHFSQYLNAQDSEQIYLVIKNYDIIQFCFKKCFDEINENLLKFVWQTDN